MVHDASFVLFDHLVFASVSNAILRWCHPTLHYLYGSTSTNAPSPSLINLHRRYCSLTALQLQQPLSLDRVMIQDTAFIGVAVHAADEVCQWVVLILFRAAIEAVAAVAATAGRP